uniref:Secreted protein n=1 Tax=Leersia perrieri TaxID=77586 RepID=A0A0D9WKL2_9ORYZ
MYPTSTIFLDLTWLAGWLAIRLYQIVPAAPASSTSFQQPTDGMFALFWVACCRLRSNPLFSLLTPLQQRTRPQLVNYASPLFCCWPVMLLLIKLSVRHFDTCYTTPYKYSSIIN